MQIVHDTDRQLQRGSFYCCSEYQAATLFLERIVILFRKSLHQNIFILTLLAEFHDLGDRFRNCHPVHSCLDAELLHQLALSLEAFLEFAHL